jgi:trehalose/maltose transport system substrate-binding protein
MELTLLKETIDEWVKRTGNEHKVEVIVLPHASNECFALYKQWLSAEAFDVDIMQMDVAWIGVFADSLADLSEFYTPNEIDIDDYFDAIKRSMYSGKRMVALPLYADCGIIYYRADLLENYEQPVPKTWQELYDVALYIQNEERKNPEKKNKFCGFVFQAKAFEMLTCNFVEIVDSFGGSLIKDGKVNVDSEEIQKSLLFLIDCLKNISTRSILNYSEEDSRGVFQSGNAVFMKNWPYAWSLLNDPSTAVAGKVKVMAIPPSEDGGKASGVLGGWFVTVSRYSRHKALAANLVKFLTCKEQQRIRSKNSYLPAFKSLYEDPQVLKDNPFFVQIRESLKNAVTRPSEYFGKNYSKASSEIFNAVNTILTDSIESKVNIKRELKRLNKKLNTIKYSEKDSEKNRPTKKEGFWNRIKKFFGF